MGKEKMLAASFISWLPNLCKTPVPVGAYLRLGVTTNHSVFVVSEVLSASLSSTQPKEASPEESKNGRVSSVVAVVLLSGSRKARCYKSA
jgi:hypothetical protein